MVQTKELEALSPLLSAAVIFTLLEPSIVGVPVINPVAGLIDSPAGNPVAL